jgi:hypothetical protein
MGAILNKDHDRQVTADKNREPCYCARSAYQSLREDLKSIDFGLGPPSNEVQGLIVEDVLRFESKLHTESIRHRSPDIPVLAIELFDSIASRLHDCGFTRFMSVETEIPDLVRKTIFRLGWEPDGPGFSRADCGMESSDNGSKSHGPDKSGAAAASVCQGRDWYDVRTGFAGNRKTRSRSRNYPPQKTGTT